MHGTVYTLMKVKSTYSIKKQILKKSHLLGAILWQNNLLFIRVVEISLEN